VVFPIGTICAQVRWVSGVITDSITKKKLQDASVVIKNQNGLIFTFAFTNQFGQFNLEMDSAIEMDSIWLAVSIIGYSSKFVRIDLKQKIYDISLNPAPNELPKVEVKRIKPVNVKDDTLSYNVEYFAQDNDRSIGDVIKRIPGLSVDNNGRISYNGQAISNLYIQGDDLMDGRYGAATKTINKDHIKSIDIMLNYQPINVLRNKVISDDIAINLTLKDPRKLKTNGQVMGGSGIPSQYEGELSTMQFNEKIKMLNVGKANNTSIDYENEITQYNKPYFLNEKGNRQNMDLLSSALAKEPDIPKSYYYLNRSGLINLNNLVNTRDSIQIKINITGFVDKNNYSFASQINNLINLNDTIIFNQLQKADRRNSVGIASITFQSNKQNAYLSNKTSVQYNYGLEKSRIIFNQDSFSQKLLSKHLDFYNDLLLIPSLRNNNLLQLKWYTNFRKMPQQLDIKSSLEDDILNNGMPYKSLHQNLLLPSFFTNASLSYLVINNSRIKQSYDVKIISEQKKIESGIIINQLNGSSNSYTGDPGNNVKWSRNLLQASAQYSYIKDEWQASLTVPFGYQHIQFKQNEFPENSTQQRLLLNPTLKFSFFVNAEDRITLSYKFKNNFGDIQNIYQGLVVKNFRLFQTNSPVIQESENNGIILRYDIRRAIKLFTASTQIQYNKISANSLIGSILNSNIQQSILLPIPNNQSTFSATGELSRYFSKIKSRASLMAAWTKMNDNQIVNSKPLLFSNDAFIINGQAEGTISGKIAFQYVGGFILNKSHQRSNNSVNNLKNEFIRLEHDFLFGYHFNKLFLNFHGRKINLWQSNINSVSFFSTDGGLRYKLTKWRADLSFDVSNIFNVKEYILFSVSSNQFNINKYPLRSRMAIGRITFNF